MEPKLSRSCVGALRRIDEAGENGLRIFGSHIHADQRMSLVSHGLIRIDPIKNRAHILALGKVYLETSNSEKPDE